jgi:hypothetical protein
MSLSYVKCCAAPTALWPICTVFPDVIIATSGQHHELPQVAVVTKKRVTVPAPQKANQALFATRATRANHDTSEWCQPVTRTSISNINKTSGSHRSDHEAPQIKAGQAILFDTAQPHAALPDRRPTTAPREQHGQKTKPKVQERKQSSTNNEFDEQA